MRAPAFIAVLTAAAGLVSAVPAGTAGKTPEAKTPVPAGTTPDDGAPQHPKIVYPDQVPPGDRFDDSKFPADAPWPWGINARKKVAMDQCTERERQNALWAMENKLRKGGPLPASWVFPAKNRKKPEDGPVLPDDWVNPCPELIAEGKKITEAKRLAEANTNKPTFV